MEAVEEFIVKSRAITLAQTVREWPHFNLPLYVNDTPVWVYACRRGARKLFYADILRNEALFSNEPVAKFKWLRTIRGFMPVDKTGILINQTKFTDAADQAAMDEVVAILSCKTSHENVLSSFQIRNLFNGDYKTYSDVNKMVIKHDWPTLIDDKPVWREAGLNAKWHFYVALLHNICFELKMVDRCIRTNYQDLLLKMQDNLPRKGIRDDMVSLAHSVPARDEDGYDYYQQCLLGPYWA
jgi:hypothetical protein